MERNRYCIEKISSIYILDAYNYNNIIYVYQHKNNFTFTYRFINNNEFGIMIRKDIWK